MPPGLDGRRRRLTAVTRARRTAAWALTIVTLVSPLAACQSTPAASDTPDEGGVVAFVDDTSEGGDSALLEGTLALDSGCLTVVSTLDGSRVLPVFRQAAVAWDGTTLQVDGGSYVVGDTISLSGGYSPQPVSAAYVPADCEFDQAFHVAT
ncbi:hypothetical protein GCM10022273_08250 [Cellulomonas soli]